MEAKECIRTRRSVRKYTDQPVSAETIGTIIETARFAPSWKNTQTARYIAVLDAELKARIASEGTAGYDWNTKIISGAPALIVITTEHGRSGYEKDGTFTTSKGTHWEAFDAGIAAEAFCLAAHAEGLATVIMGIYSEDAVREILQLPEELGVSALIALGYPAEEGKNNRRKEVSELLTVR